MKKNLLLILSLLLCSCTHLNNENTGLEPVTEIEGPAMYGIKVFQQNQLKFSGILAVKKDAEKLDYVLLDASGVNLISAAVDKDKQIKVKQAVAEMKKRGFVDYFSTVLYRIFIQQPEKLPCEGSLLHFFCVDGKEKAARFGPLLHWSFKQAETETAAFVYLQSFFGVRVELNPMR